MKKFVTSLATTDHCVVSICASVYASFLLESVMLAGGRRLVLGGLRLSPWGLQGYSASALRQLLLSLLALRNGDRGVGWLRCARVAISRLSLGSSESMKASLARWAQLSSGTKAVATVQLCVRMSMTIHRTLLRNCLSHILVEIFFFMEPKLQYISDCQDKVLINCLILPQNKEKSPLSILK